MQRSIIAPAERVTNLRWGMLALVAALVLAVSVDGTALVLGGWTDFDRPAFIVAMIVAQLPAGLLIDRYGVRRVGAAAALLWWLGTLGAAFAAGAGTVAASAAVGIAVSVALPLAMKSTASWFPRSERGRATAIILVAASAPVVLTLSPYVPKLAAGLAPIAALAFTAVAGIAFALLYREPNDARVTHAERTYIADGGAQPVAAPDVRSTFAALVRSRNVWAMAFGFGAFSYAFGFGAVQVWGVAWSPLALILMVLLGGLAVDVGARQDGRGLDKLCLAIFTFMSTLWLGVWRFHGAESIAFASLILIGYVVALPIAWSIPGRIAPRGAVGLVAAIMSLAGTIGAALVWFSADDPLGADIAGLIAALTFAFVLGRIEPIRDPV